jgi:prolyl-tRNA synthetase
MLRAGMIRQEAAGSYAWLPLGVRVLHKICAIIREEQNRAGAIEVLMPTIQSADLWRESGRYDDYGKEMLRIRDRHDRDMLYGPTNEEMITESSAPRSAPTRTCRSISITSSGSFAMKSGRASASCARANS